MKQYAIHILRDIDAENPWHCDEGLPPILVASSAMRGYDVRGYGLEERVPRLDRNVVLKHWREMLEMLDLLPTMGALKELTRNYYYGNEPVDRALACSIDEFITDANISDRFEMLATVYGWLGMPAYVGSTSGYCQGDYALVLVVLTSDWCTRMGIDFDKPSHQFEEKDFRRIVDTYGAWAFGDVYGWAVTEATEDYEEAVGCYELGVSEEGNVFCKWEAGRCPKAEYIESCWGYYGHWEHWHMVAEADEVIAYLQEKDAEEAKEKAYWEDREVMTVEN